MVVNLYGTFLDFDAMEGKDAVTSVQMDLHPKKTAISKENNVRYTKIFFVERKE